ncbi:ANK_REP_REGION domain-containing protein [Trichonephila clavata]|uniref:ANK_REP_REGION domain-containing protein n=1 Tax=Trichonephila clavata TaxID=2740835 RepID=A0A8X6LVR9_TRICU|nr:ANK_REP_REGION domain-containing protein [Trichonephila clavata]
MFKEVPVLRFMALTRVVRLLWSGYDVQNSMAEYFLEGDQTLENWSSIEESLKLKISNCLVLPKELRAVLSSLVKPVGGCIKDIIEHIYGDDYLPSHFMGRLSWTSLGIIDLKKTAKAVLKDENLPITKRYEIACTYCLEDKIQMLWSELPETNKMDYLKENGPIRTQPYFPIYWTYYMRAELNSLEEGIRDENYAKMSCHYLGILIASFRDNQVAVEYFLGKLSAEEKEQFFSLFFPCVEYPLIMNNYKPSNSYACDVIYFLLSQMNANQRTSIFEKCGSHILNSFFVFPYGGMILEIGSVVQKYLTHDQRKALERRHKETIRYCVFRTLGNN